MRIKMTPELAYVIGLWKGRKASRGVGIRGSGEIREVFLKEALKTLKIPPQKIQLNKNEIYFYHSAYRKFFEEAERNQLDVFRKKNDYSASYLAGLFDSCGGVKGDTPYLARASEKEQMLLELLGFRARFIEGKLAILTSNEFFAFVEKFLKHSKALMQSGNERDRC